MIVKHIPARPAGRDATVERAAHARNLIDYLRLPEKESEEKAYQVAYMLAEKLGDTKGERLFHIGGRGFVSTDIEGQRAEMIAVAQSAKRSPNPIDHWLLSWREGELPTSGQVDGAVALFLEHLGVADQPCIYACHGDTDNRHVHLAINRYDPIARRMVEINDGFTREAAHQAVALIIDRFGWQAEADARYEVVNGRAVLTASAGARIAEGRKGIRPKAAAFENRTGYRSAQRIAQEDAVPLIKAAASWRDLHAALAAVGIAYDATGTNGVMLTVGGERVRASSVDRAITRTRLEKRLGAFEPREAALAIPARDPDGDRFPEAFRADEYRAERERWRRWQETRRAERAADRILPENAIDKARGAARQRAAPPKRPPPDLESWYYHCREGAFAARWRHRRRAALLPALVGIGRAGVDLPGEVDGYRGFPCSDGTRYACGPDEPTAFIDRGDRIEVAATDDKALLAALRLAAIKFDGKVAVRGSAAFRERAFALAQANGLGPIFTDADLAARHASLRPSGGRVQQRATERQPVLPTATTLKSEKLSDNRQDDNSRSPRAGIHKSTRPRPHGLGPVAGLAGLRALSSIGMDRRSRAADGLLPGVPRDHVRGRTADHEVRGAGRHAVAASGASANTPAEDPMPPAGVDVVKPDTAVAPRKRLLDLAREIGPPTRHVVSKGGDAPAPPSPTGGRGRGEQGR